MGLSLKISFIYIILGITKFKSKIKTLIGRNILINTTEVLKNY